MANKFSTSANIIRDEKRKLDYVVTPNAEGVCKQIEEAYKNGIHSFTLIGSYGTGKSSFLLAFHESLLGNGPLDVELGFELKKVETLRFVGQYQSLIRHFQEHFDIEDDFSGNQKIFDRLFELKENSDLLVIYLDEFGKFLEYASKHNPDRELYFLQQLAEFVNDHDRDIILISTLHQSFETYGSNMVQESQKREWKKVKGRFKELTFNEPVEQLLYLAAEKLGTRKATGPKTALLAKRKHLLGMNEELLEKIESKISPLDVISAGILTRALQTYGQNERSLFTFLESDLKDDSWFSVSKVFDHVLTSFYSYLESSHNPHYRQWRAIMSGTDRIESSNIENLHLALDVFKTVSMLQLFGYKGAHIDAETLLEYLGESAAQSEITNTLKALQGRRLITFAKYNNSFKVIEGTDVDFDHELHLAEESVDRSFDVATVLEEHFTFPVLQAKEISYMNGTPRLFSFKISADVETSLKPKGAMDGFINLVFNEDLELAKNKSLEISEAVLVACFTNADDIKDRIFEILKTKKVLNDVKGDNVAKQEFLNILNSHERLLTHEVIGSLYTDKVKWVFQGSEQGKIESPKELNKLLSEVCRQCYPKAPIFRNELLNKDKISTSIHTARKNYFLRLSENWNEKDLGFEDDKFPPEKTIYQTLIQANGMHQKINGQWELTEPSAENGFDQVWDACKEFLEDARNDRRKISELWKKLESRPFKLKQGLIDFWVPTFLFINRGDFALYEEDRFIPSLNDSILYLITRQPHKYSVKSFEITELRLKVFNKYREVLQQDDQERISASSLIESLKPFLAFYKSLNDYAKQTTTISEAAQNLRASIIGAQDLEETFFEAIPKALMIDIDLSNPTDEKLSEFAVKLNEAIDELKTAFPELVNRFETFICDTIVGERLEFADYQKILIGRYEAIQEHRLLPKQKVFLNRLNNPIPDRDSWLNSVCQGVIGKSLDQLLDKDEEILKEGLTRLLKELDNLQELHGENLVEGEEVLRLEITTLDGFIEHQNVRIPKRKQKEVEEVSNMVSKLLQKYEDISLEVLSKLIEKKLKK